MLGLGFLSTKDQRKDPSIVKKKIKSDRRIVFNGITPFRQKKKYKLPVSAPHVKLLSQSFFKVAVSAFFFARFGTPCKIPISKCFLKFPFRLIFARFGTTMKVVSDLN